MNNVADEAKMRQRGDKLFAGRQGIKLRLVAKRGFRTVTALISSILKTWSVLDRVVTRNQLLLWKIRRCGATVSWLRPLTCSVTVR
jgi:hypothetical protein